MSDFKAGGDIFSVSRCTPWRSRAPRVRPAPSRIGCH